MPNTIDPLDYEERLTQAGVPAEQAHVHAEAIGQVKSELDAIDERAKATRIENRVDQGFAKVEKDLDAMHGKIDTCLAELNSKIDTGLAELNSKIDTGLAELNTKIDTGLAELNTKIDRTRAELDAKIDQTRVELEAQMQKIKWETICWTIGIVISICSLQGFIIVNVLR
ncbi:DUF1640 domain-containing protein [Pseudoduganella sp. DS3]|uniref:DUF1640 domain-containing protein n=1 Tax=Pseudoduganella guangdongensis TaxID=2692179 RepID=A0A6N9HDN6_9BURK|nr:DUF1640 domain-containing protein [Pseudoduganella guangdongensis]MYN00985.1 DUF1640 domain-containing protein [Pseudoduganella guangdongensis]